MLSIWGLFVHAHARDIYEDKNQESFRTKVRPILYSALIQANRQFPIDSEGSGAGSHEGASDSAVEHALLVIRRRLAVKLAEDRRN